MRIIALLLLFYLAVPHLAQEAEEERANERESRAEFPVAGVPLESPFLQADLELLVGNVQRPNGIVWFNDSLFTVCNGDWTVYKIDVVTGDTVTFVFGTRNANSLIAEGTAAGFDLWIPDSDTGTIWQLDQNRAAPVSIISELAAPWGMTRLDAERFLVTDSRLNTILEVSVSGASRQVHAELRSPTGIVRQGEYIYFANGGSARRGIEYFEVGDDGVYSEAKPLVSGLQNTSNITIGADGQLYFAYALGTRGVVGRVDPAICLADGCSNDDVELLVFSDIPAPLAITLSDDLRLFLHSRYRPEIYWLQLPTTAPTDSTS